MHTLHRTRHRRLFRCRLAALLTLGVLAAGSAGAAGVVNISHAAPEGFTDAGDYGRGRAETLARLSAHLTQLGTRWLADGQSLQLELLDIDLAGRLKPLGTRGEVRVVTGGADWPRVTLRFRLEAGGRVLQSGEASLSDLNYLQHAATRHDADPLRYEKAMLDRWFKAQFAAAAAP